MPEGFVLAPQRRDAFVALAGKHGLAAEAAQEIVGFAVEWQKEQAAAAEAEFQQSLVASRSLLQQDPVLSGPNFDANIKQAAATFQKFADPETAALIESVGLHVHPGFVRAWHAVAQQLSESRTVPAPGGAPPAAKTEQEILRQRFPSMFGDAPTTPKKVPTS